MQQPKFYPELSPALRTTLNTWKKLIESDPEYLNDEDCPYSGPDIDLLKSLFESAPKATSVTASDVEDPNEVPDFEIEALQLYRDMKNFKSDLNARDTSEMTSTFRTMVSLMEKILDVQERASGIKQFGVFKTFILDMMERYLDPSQLSEFVDEMKLKLNQE
tara:strand:- start:3711 stop:4196 length:486 start_codon:yes stop_codon:yes gene_type:complete